MKFLKKYKVKKRKKDYLINEWFENIKKELNNHSYDEIVKFTDLFPCKDEYFYISRSGNIITTKNDFHQVVINKARSVGITTPYFEEAKKFFANWNGCGTIPNKYLNLPPERYVTCSSTQDFWKRWNRFKKIRVYL